MTREEQIKEAAVSFCRVEEAPDGFAFIPQSSFVTGALWADAHPNWISVEDEMPPQNGRYIFFSDTMGVRTSYYYAGISLNEHVTHWMPLPEPPKKGGEE